MPRCPSGSAGSTPHREGGVDLAPQVGDVGLHDGTVAAEVVVPHVVEDLRLGDDPAGVEHEVAQQRELGGRELERDAGARDLVRVLVEDDVVVAQQAVVDRHGRRLPPQQRAHPSDDLLEAERLGDVVVAAEGQPGHLVLDRVARGEEQHGRLAAVGAEAPGDLEAVDVGHHHVEHEQVGPPLAHGGERLEAGAGRPYVEADEPQTGREQVGDVRLVVDDEHAGLGTRSVGHVPSGAGFPVKFLGGA